MAIHIYKDYSEFISYESEIVEQLEAFDTSDYNEEEEEDEDFLGFERYLLLQDNSTIPEDSICYIAADEEDEEFAEQIADNLGRNAKLDLKEIHKIFFYLK